MHRGLPTLAVLLGIAGVVPVAATGLASVSATDLARAARYLGALVAYCAVALAFLGGVHWGLVLGRTAPGPAAAPVAGERYRLGLGVLPPLVSWLALLVQLLLALPDLALAILIAGFVAAVATEAELRRRALMPPGYMWLRWALRVVVVAILATVLTLRLVGGRVIF